MYVKQKLWAVLAADAVDKAAEWASYYDHIGHRSFTSLVQNYKRTPAFAAFCTPLCKRITKPTNMSGKKKKKKSPLDGFLLCNFFQIASGSVQINNKGKVEE